MKVKICIIWIGLASLLLWACGSGVNKEEIHDLPEFEAGYYTTALDALNEHIENTPENPDTYFEKGKVLEQLNRPDQAIISYKKALTLDSLNPGYYKGVSRLFLQQHKLDRAEENALKALRLGDQTAGLHYLLCDIYVKKGAFTVALNHLNEAIENAPRNSEYLFQKGRIYLQLGDTTRAREFLLSNLGKIDKGSEVYEALADIYSAESNFSEAVVYIDSSLLFTNKGAQSPLLIKKAGLLQKAGELSAAKMLLNQHLQEDSANFAFNFKLAELHYQSYTYDSALHYLNNALLLDSKSKEAFLLMGKVYDRKYMYYTARDQFKNALLIDTSYQQAKMALQDLERKLAYIYRQRKKEKEAQESLPQVKSVEPE